MDTRTRIAMQRLGLLDKRYKEPTVRKAFVKKNGKLRAKHQRQLDAFTANNASSLAARVAVIDQQQVYVDLLRNKIRIATRTMFRTGQRQDVRIDFRRASLTRVFNMFNPVAANFRFNTDDGGIITLTQNNIQQVRDMVSGDAEETDYDSLNTWITNITQEEQMTLTVSPRGNLPEGGFFPYISLLDKVDLSEFGIYTNVKPEEDNCLILALKTAGYDTTKAHSFVKSQFIPRKDLKTIAEKMGLEIHIKRLDKNDNSKGDLIYNEKKDLPIVELGCFEKHFFLIKDTKYASYAIKNYFEICERFPNREDWMNICDKKGTPRKDRKMNSFQLIKQLLKQKSTHLRELTSQEAYKLYNFKSFEQTLMSDLTYDEKDIQPVKENVIKDRREEACVFFDFETTTEGEIHVPYCAYTDKNLDGYWGADCALLMLRDLTRKYGSHKTQKMPNCIRCFAHHLGYDMRFLVNHLYKVETLDKGSGIMCGSGTFYYGDKRLVIHFTDTLRMINMRLDKFGETFHLDTQKEILPYNLYTQVNVAKRVLPLRICLPSVDDEADKATITPCKHTREEYRKIFLTNCKRWGCFCDGGGVDILKYSGEYCKMDVLTLKGGYYKFRSLVQEAIGLDITDYVTLASMAHDHLIKQGCYDGVIKMSGVPRAFIQRCVVGGRTMCKRNEKQAPRDDTLDDFDGVSLYSSAMVRLIGFLIGDPKIIESFEPEKYSGYFVCVRITKVGKHLDFPLGSIITEDGVRNFTNHLEGKYMYVDKTSLEDLVNFQQVEYEFINGYYFDEGHNTQIKTSMQYLFDQRLKYKNDKNMRGQSNPLQLVFKELMNSAYGKTIMKPIEEKCDYVKREEIDKFLDRHHNHIKIATLLPNGRMYKVRSMKTIDKHFNSPQVGVEVLSMSKRIMNEVICTAEDKGLGLFYQDTDSMHIYTKDVPILAAAFQEKYNRELIGKALGQFHTDFDLEGACGPIVSTESYFLGKKCYIDRLKSVDKDGNDLSGWHIKMKGVPESSIKHKAMTENCEVIDLYKRMYEGERLGFDLTAVRPKFEMNANMTIRSKSSFTRNVGF